ncbi:MAG: D-3-phosphoglycerate dehydrogenase [Candidatus Electronema aureum]|uniref:D-3-phosphoglycerate dehydrogenase n=1 Tax=Candidatus Electronema aureum TaxID=2005002 RepID=A0A521G2M0_9BACT|nr:MAG: D-3-phosphoglycerate dehydrogenase [Candidatus Electronema aureum]
MNRCAIHVMNAVSAEGLALFGSNFRLEENRAAAHGLLVRSSPVNLAEFPELEAIARAGAGVNNIPLDEATEKGICVFNTPGANANAVVELVFTMLGIWLRHVPQGLAFCQGLTGFAGPQLNAEIEARKKMFRGQELADKTLGIIGLGQIGVRAANMGIHHNMRVIGYDPYPVLDNIHRLLPDVRLAQARQEVLAQADYVSLHVPLNKATAGLVNAEFLAGMKKGAVLLNYARGPIADDEAVLKALESGHLAAYLSDFPTEKLLGHEKVLFTPHLGASTSESEEHCTAMAVQELKNYLEYGTVTHSVNFPNVESIPATGSSTRLIMINRDIPGMIGLVSNILGKHGINIMSYTNKSNGAVGYNIIDTENPVSLEVRREIEAVGGVIRVRIIPLKNEFGLP